MMQYRYKIKPLAQRKIRSFYYNVAKKYRHTYSKWLMHKNIDDAVDAMFEIENGLLRREPTIERWNGYHMANTEKWYSCSFHHPRSSKKDSLDSCNSCSLKISILC